MIRPAIGDRIDHEAYGLGTVVSSHGERVLIQLDQPYNGWPAYSTPARDFEQHPIVDGCWWALSGRVVGLGSWHEVLYLHNG